MSRSRIGWVLVAIQFALMITLLVVPWRKPEPVSLIIGIAVLVGGLTLGVLSFRALGSALTANPVPREKASLVTKGVYAQVRHPIYTAVVLAAAGFTLAVGSMWTLLVAIGLAVFLFSKSRWEDRLLARKFGAEWDEWAKRTGALVPKIRR